MDKMDKIVEASTMAAADKAAAIVDDLSRMPLDEGLAYRLTAAVGNLRRRQLSVIEDGEEMLKELEKLLESHTNDVLSLVPGFVDPQGWIDELRSFENLYLEGDLEDAKDWAEGLVDDLDEAYVVTFVITGLSLVEGLCLMQRLAPALGALMVNPEILAEAGPHALASLSTLREDAQFKCREVLEIVADAASRVNAWGRTEWSSGAIAPEEARAALAALRRERRL